MDRLNYSGDEGGLDLKEWVKIIMKKKIYLLSKNQPDINKAMNPGSHSHSLSHFATTVLLFKWCLPYNFDSKAKILTNTSLSLKKKHLSVINFSLCLMIKVVLELIVNIISDLSQMLSHDMYIIFYYFFLKNIKT